MSYLVFKDQKSFMNYFKQEPSPKTAALYHTLVGEEYGELQHAWAAHTAEPTAETVTEIADACLDLIYVAAGLMHALGLNPQPLWDEVHRSNVEKIKHPCLSCETTGTVTLTATGHGACPDCTGQGYVYEVRLRDDGKVLKPTAWYPPQLLPFVQHMLGSHGA